MGICKCKKRTDLFCFVHKKPVCEECACTEHQLCVVKTYIAWLTDSDYDPPHCLICKGELKEGDVLRLMCLDLFHPECIDVHAKSLPQNTAKAGYSCPACSLPLFPTEENNSYLANQLNRYLSQASWASHLLIGKDSSAIQKTTSVNPGSGATGHSDVSLVDGPLLLNESSLIASPSPASLSDLESSTRVSSFSSPHVLSSKWPASNENSKDGISRVPSGNLTSLSKIVVNDSFNENINSNSNNNGSGSISANNSNSNNINVSVNDNGSLSSGIGKNASGGSPVTISSALPHDSHSSGIASRKLQTKEHYVRIGEGSNNDLLSNANLDGDDDDDYDVEGKYKKRSVVQLMYALGLAKSASLSTTKGQRGPPPIRIDTRRLLILFALLFSIVSMIIFFSTLISDLDSRDLEN